MAVTADYEVYGWGSTANGQLGNGESRDRHIEKPVLLQNFRKNVERVCAGNGFSIFLSNKGLLMSCGDVESGCLGNFTKQACLVPKIIDDLISLHISDISCGEKHVMAVSEAGDVFAWGLNPDGRLGIEVQSAQPVMTPTQVTFPPGIKIKRVFCGNDSSMFLDEMGCVWACGSNKFNKLGLNEVTLTRVKKVERSLYPERLKGLKDSVVSVGIGPVNTTLLFKSGNVLVLGSNEEAQMSCGHIGFVGRPTNIRCVSDQEVRPRFSRSILFSNLYFGSFVKVQNEDGLRRPNQLTTM